MQNDETPEVKHMTLGEILTPAQMEHALTLMNTHQDDIDLANALKEYLAQFKEELLAKGLDSDYLAYKLIEVKYNAMNNSIDIRGDFSKN